VLVIQNQWISFYFVLLLFSSSYFWNFSELRMCMMQNKRWIERRIAKSKVNQCLFGFAIYVFIFLYNKIMLFFFSAVQFVLDNVIHSVFVFRCCCCCYVCMHYNIFIKVSFLFTVCRKKKTEKCSEHWTFLHVVFLRYSALYNFRSCLVFESGFIFLAAWIMMTMISQILTSWVSVSFVAERRANFTFFC
jgi:hypothetical protein